MTTTAIGIGQKELPAGWKWVKLGDVCEVVNGYGFGTKYQGHEDLRYPFIKVSDMNSEGSEKVVSYSANTVDEEILKALKAKTYPVGTIIFPKVGGALLTNKKRILGVESTFDNNVMGLIAKTVETEWLYLFMLTIDLASLSNTTALPSIRKSIVEQISFPLPPLEEQKRIAAKLNEQNAAASLAKESIQQELDTIEAMPASLLRKAFSGE